MSAKVIFLVVALVQSAICQCVNRAALGGTGYAAPYAWSGPGLAYNGLAAPALAVDGLGVAGRGLTSNLEFTPTSGGTLAVTSSSAIPPTGISVVSENAFEGALNVAGELPFVGSSAVDGVVPSAGDGAINHACGNGVNAMESEITIAPTSAIIPPVAATFAPASPLSPAARIPPSSGLGLGNSLGFRGYGNRGLVY